MARIADDVIERIKTEVSLVRLAESQGYPLQKQGKDLALLCPFHEEKTPSCKITPAKNLFHCLGCGVGGSVIDWYMQTQRVSFRRAADVLQHELGLVPSPLVAHSVTVYTVPSLPMSTDADDQALLAQVVDFYRNTLLQSPEALAYLQSRGLDHPELISTFNLGYANRTLAYQLPHKRRLDGAQQRGRLQALGVLRKSGHEHLNGSIVIPLYDQQNHITQLYGRKIRNDLREGTKLHLYLEQPKTGIFNHAGLVNCKEIILCESLIDAMTFWCAGFRNVTTALGASSFNDELLNYFKVLGVEKVLIAFDRDKAGHENAQPVSKKLNQQGMDTFRVLFPKGMDANEYALKVTPAHKSLEIALRKAEWMGNGVNKTLPDITDALTETTAATNEKATKGKMMSEIQSVSDVENSVIAPNPSPLVAVVATAAATGEIKTEITDSEINLTLESRHYRVRGLNKNLSHELLKINLLVKIDSLFYVDTLDLYSAKARAVYVKQAALELGLAETLLKSDLGSVLLQLEEIQDQLIRGTLSKAEKRPVMSESELNAAMSFLTSPRLMQQILSDFACCGIVGEEANKQVAYLAAVSRKLERPLAVMVQSSSAAGKSSLMDAVLKFVPEEERIQYSAMTGQSLFYLGEKDLKHKILAISEEEGAHSASYALKLLQSEGVVSIASTGKNAITGNLETQEYRVEGPVMLFSTTTAIDPDEELMNRCLVLSVDEGSAQTQAVHAQQRKRRTLEGFRASEDKQALIHAHQNAQRLLQPLKIFNPYAEHLTFVSDKTRTRRDNEKYLALIDSITLLHQHQREIKRETYNNAVIEYVEVTLADIELANQLAHEVLGRTLDELPPQTRKLLTLVCEMVARECAQLNIKRCDYRFTRKQIRDVTGWGNTQLKMHLARLEDMEFLGLHKSARGKAIAYELLFDGEATSDERHLMGLINTEDLKKYRYDFEKSGVKKEKSVQGRPQVGSVSGGGRVEEIIKNTEKSSVKPELLTTALENALIDKINGHRSYDVLHEMSS
jgi:DNA primase